MEEEEKNMVGNMPDSIQSRVVRSRKLKRIFGKSALVLILIVLLVFISSAAISFFFEDEVANTVLRQVYKSVDTEMSHSKVSLSLWRKFPKVSLKVDDLSVKAKNSNDNLLEAKTVYLQLNLFRLLQNSFELQKLNVEHVRLYLESYSENRHNWDIFRESDDSSETGLSLALASVSLSDISIFYTDDENLFTGSGHINRMTAKGRFRDEKFDFRLSAMIQIDSLLQDTMVYCLNKGIRLKGDAVADFAQKQYELHNFNIGVLRINTVLEAVARQQGEDWQYEANLVGKKMSVGDLIKQLPDVYQRSLDSLELQGNLNLAVVLRGSAKTQTGIEAVCQLEKGYVRPNESPVALKSVEMKMLYTSQFPDLASHSVIKVPILSANLESGRITGKAEVTDLNSPHFRANLQASLQLSDLQAFIPKTVFYKIGGKADFKLEVEHIFSSMENVSFPSLKDAEIKGSMTLKKACLQIDSNSFLWDDFSASLKFDNQTLNIIRFNGSVQGNRCELTGSVSPVYDFFFVDNCKLKVEGQLYAPMLNVDAFIPPVTTQTVSASQNEVSRAVHFPDFVEAEIRLKSDRLKYDRFEAQKVEGLLKYKGDVLSVEDLSLKALDGKVLMQAGLRSLPSGGFRLQTKASVRQVDIQRLFYVLHDFGYTEENGLTHNNIRGKATSDIQMVALLDSCLVLLPESIDCNADLTLVNGRLLNFKPLEALSAFVKLEDLKDIRFETLTNRITIQNKQIQIPEMDIKNNLLNLVLSGGQTFDGDLNYNISLYLSDLLSNKRKNRVSSDEFGEVVEDGKYGVRLHILLAGNTENPQFKWNRKKANEGFRQGFKQQREEFRELFGNGEKDKSSSVISSSVSDTLQGKAYKRKKENQDLNDSKKKQQELDIDDW